MGRMFFDEIVDDGFDVEFDQFADVVEVIVEGVAIDFALVNYIFDRDFINGVVLK